MRYDDDEWSGVRRGEGAQKAEKNNRKQNWLPYNVQIPWFFHRIFWRIVFELAVGPISHSKWLESNIIIKFCLNSPQKKNQQEQQHQQK